MPFIPKESAPDAQQVVRASKSPDTTTKLYFVVLAGRKRGIFEGTDLQIYGEVKPELTRSFPRCCTQTFDTLEDAKVAAKQNQDEKFLEKWEEENIATFGVTPDIARQAEPPYTHLFELSNAQPRLDIAKWRRAHILSIQKPGRIGIPKALCTWNRNVVPRGPSWTPSAEPVLAPKAIEVGAQSLPNISAVQPAEATIDKLPTPSDNASNGVSVASAKLASTVAPEAVKKSIIGATSSSTPVRKQSTPGGPKSVRHSLPSAKLSSTLAQTTTLAQAAARTQAQNQVRVPNVASIPPVPSNVTVLQPPKPLARVSNGEIAKSRDQSVVDLLNDLTDSTVASLSEHDERLNALEAENELLKRCIVELRSLINSKILTQPLDAKRTAQMAEIGEKIKAFPQKRSRLSSNGLSQPGTPT